MVEDPGDGDLRRGLAELRGEVDDRPDDGICLFDEIAEVIALAVHVNLPGLRVW